MPPESTTIVHHVNQALRAHKLFFKDQQYVVMNGEVMLIDEFTGRMMKGRRLSDGLHQAIEAKEGVKINPENVTYASVTFQNYFRLYEKLGGMTGTAATEAEEFREIYGLGVVEVPTNRPVARIDEHDQVFRTAREKYDGILKAIKEAHEKGQPILVGTTSIEKSEQLSEPAEDGRHPAQRPERPPARDGSQDRRRRRQAGRGDHRHQHGRSRHRHQTGRQRRVQGDGGHRRRSRKAITSPSAPGSKPSTRARKRPVKAAGGLFVLGTERHESRRIDNQLRGRSGRQGDPGRSAFFLSLEDDLMRIFGSERLDKILSTLGMKEGESIVHPWVNKRWKRRRPRSKAATSTSASSC